MMLLVDGAGGSSGPVPGSRRAGTGGDDEAYARHTGVTQPGGYADLLRSLPADPRRLVPLLQNVLVHHTRADGFAAGTGRADDGTELRPVRAVLERISALDDRPWDARRGPGRRLVVDCRGFAVLMCAVLREHGVPARVRFGFAGYLADRYGYAPDLRGRWALRYELLRDVAALTGFEPLTSDAWGPVPGLPVDPAVEYDLFDRAADARTRARWLAVAAHPAFAVPPRITTSPYLTGEVYEVDLAAEGSLPVRA